MADVKFFIPAAMFALIASIRFYGQHHWRSCSRGLKPALCLLGLFRGCQLEGIITGYPDVNASTGISGQASAVPLEGVLCRPRVLIVDSDVIEREIVARKLSTVGCLCQCVPDMDAALDLLPGSRVDLVLAESDDTGLIKDVMRISPDTAVILVTSVVNVEVAVDALKDGAYDYITKPFSLEELSISVSRALEKRKLLLENRQYQHMLEEQVASRTRQLTEALRVLQHTYRSTLAALSRALDSRDADPDGHSLRVTVYAKHLAERMGLDDATIRVIEQGVLLHDIGKIGIPDDLIRKRGDLTEEEWFLVSRHPEIGYRILSSIKFLKQAAVVVYHHHERFDGKGYPQGLAGEKIDLGARIFAVADTLDYLTAGGGSFDSVAKKIEEMSGAQLDPAIVDEFLRIPIPEWERMHQELTAGLKCADFLQLGPGSESAEAHHFLIRE